MQRLAVGLLRPLPEAVIAGPDHVPCQGITITYEGRKTREGTLQLPAEIWLGPVPGECRLRAAAVRLTSSAYFETQKSNCASCVCNRNNNPARRAQAFNLSSHR